MKKMSSKKTKVLSVRIPLDDFARYENNCVNHHIEMADFVRDAIKKFVKGYEIKHNFKSLAE